MYNFLLIGCKSIISTLLIASSSVLFAQYSYDVQLDTDYDTLTTYTSLSKLAISEGQGPFAFELEINLDFDFPFFDTVFRSLILNTDGEYYPNDDSYRNIYLFNASFLTDLRIDYAKPWLSSDIRLGRSESDRGKAIHIEYHDVYSEDEVLLRNNYNNKFNFIHSIYEDGTIAVQFGSSNLDGMEYFRDGVGWLSDLNFPEPDGPYFGLEGDENQTNEVFFVYGELGNLQTLTSTMDTFDVIRNYPPEGMYFSISRDSISSVKEQGLPKESPNFKILKSLHEYTVVCSNCVNPPTLTLNSITGNLISKNRSDKISISSLPRGTYILTISDDNNYQSVLIHK